MNDVKIEIIYEKDVDKFLHKNSHIITKKEVRELIIKAMQRLFGIDTNIDLKKLKGKYSGKFRIKKGNLRIIFSYVKGVIYIALVEEINYRGDIYKKR